MVTIAPLQTYQGAALDPIGNYNKGMMGALAREEAQMMRDDRSKAQMREEQTQNILSQNLPAEELSRQLLAVNPQMANTILAMENTRQQGALNSQQIRMNDMAMAQQRIQQRKAQFATEAKAAQGVYDALQGVEDPEQKSKIYDLSMRRLEELGLDVPDELKRGWSPENEENLMRIATIGKKMLDLDPANGEQFTLKPGETRFDAQGNVIAEIEEDATVTPEARNLTPGQKKTDEKFAEEYVDWNARGGYADVQKQIQQLKEARDVLGYEDPETGEFVRNKNITGAIRGKAPDWLRTITNPDAVGTKETIEEVVQRNLRLVLGSQFTQEEGERLIKRAYNDNLDEETNYKRVSRLIQQIERAAQAKQSASEYYEQYGTLNGWQGKISTLSDFEDAIDDVSEPKTQGLENYSIEELQQMLEGM